MNRVDRLLGMILFLQGRRVVRAEDMAAHYEISVRTVYRDLEALGEVGVPIVAEAGVGYSLVRGYHLPPVMFTAQEAGAIATGSVLVNQFTDVSLQAPMQSALMKIRAVLPIEQQRHLENIERSIAFPRHKTTDAVNLIELQQALAQRRVVRIEYQGAKDEQAKPRDIEPLFLIYYLERWHLMAWCRLRQDVRDFRTDRIQRITILKETFTPRDDVTYEKLRDLWRKESTSLTAKVLFAPLSAERARREWSLGVQNEVKRKDGSVLTLCTGSFDWMTGWLLSFGSNATVLEPPELRQRVIEAAERALAHHRKAS